MAVHFDFVLDDQDAENLFEILDMEKIRLLDKGMEAFMARDFEKQKFYKRSATYVEDIKVQMKNIQVGS
jgi:methionyl-tRNA formyltransferase